MNHYTYYSYEEWGRGYIGVRSCDCLPEEDLYFGSYSDPTFEPTQKIILSTHETREEANQAEVKLHKFFNVGLNNHFANKANQTASGFTTYGITPSKETRQKMSERRRGAGNHMWGKTHSEETRQKIREARRNQVISEETRQKMREAHTGRAHSEEAKRKISKASKTRSKEKSSMWGKTHSEETKQKMREAAKKRWANHRTVTDD